MKNGNPEGARAKLGRLLAKLDKSKGGRPPKKGGQAKPPRRVGVVTALVVWPSGGNAGGGDGRVRRLAIAARQAGLMIVGGRSR
jgi:hypothetical protein